MMTRNNLIALAFCIIIMLALDFSGILPGIGRFTGLLLLLAASVIFWDAVRPSEAAATETQFTIPREAAQQARLDVQFGAGSITIVAGDDDGTLLAADCFGPVRQQVEHHSDRAHVTLRQTRTLRRDRANWRLQLNPDVVWQDLRIMCASAEADLALQALSIESLRLELGSTQADIMLPAIGHVDVQISGGQTTLTVPAGANVIVENRAKLAKVTIDETLFTPDGDPAATMPITWRSSEHSPDSPALHITLRGGFGSILLKSA